MKITGKAREDFYKWCKIQNNLKLGVQIPNTMGGVVFDLSSSIEVLPETFQHALIIEWFDSVGIFISTPPYYMAIEKYNRGFESIIFDEKS